MGTRVCTSAVETRGEHLCTPPDPCVFCYLEPLSEGLSLDPSSFVTLLLYREKPGLSSSNLMSTFVVRESTHEGLKEELAKVLEKNRALRYCILL